jgi:hypothetical protein
MSYKRGSFTYFNKDEAIAILLAGGSYRLNSHGNHVCFSLWNETGALGSMTAATEYAVVAYRNAHGITEERRRVKDCKMIAIAHYWNVQ